RIDKQVLAKVPNFANDLELATVLKDKGILTEDEIRELFTKQVTGILTEVLAWPDGEWTFSPLARLRTGIHTDVKVNYLLIDHAKTFSVDAMSFRFKGIQEKFALASNPTAEIELDPQEAFVLSRLTPDPNTLADVRFLTGLQENEALKTLYMLWFA